MPQSGFTPIITYNTATASAAPSAGNLTQGELAVNVTDKKIYTKNSGGSVVQVGSGPDATETLTNKTLTSPDINGGTIDGTAIGSTTPAAGSFTTLSAGSTTTGAHTINTGSVANISTVYTNAGSTRWTAYLGGAGLDYRLSNYNDSGVQVGDALTISRSTGAVTIPGSATAGTLNTASAAVGTTNVGLNRFEAASSSFAGDVVQIYGYSNSDTYNALRIVDNGGNVKLNVRGNGAVTIPGSLSLVGGTFGYGVGAGGTVTQATSKSTAVTLNKPSGQITMNNAALAAGAFESFYLYSSYITDTSVLLVQGIHDGTVNPANYTISCVQIYGATNRSLIKVVNTSAGSLSEAVVLRFAVISGANA